METVILNLSLVLIFILIVSIVYGIYDDIKTIRQLRRRIKEQKKMNEDFKKRHNL